MPSKTDEHLKQPSSVGITINITSQRQDDIPPALKGSTSPSIPHRGNARETASDSMNSGYPYSNPETPNFPPLFPPLRPQMMDHTENGHGGGHIDDLPFLIGPHLPHMGHDWQGDVHTPNGAGMMGPFTPMEYQSAYMREEIEVQNRFELLDDDHEEVQQQREKETHHEQPEAGPSRPQGTDAKDDAEDGQTSNGVETQVEQDHDVDMDRQHQEEGPAAISPQQLQSPQQSQAVLQDIQTAPSDLQPAGLASPAEDQSHPPEQTSAPAEASRMTSQVEDNERRALEDQPPAALPNEAGPSTELSSEERVRAEELVRILGMEKGLIPMESGQGNEGEQAGSAAGEAQPLQAPPQKKQRKEPVIPGGLTKDGKVKIPREVTYAEDEVLQGIPIQPIVTWAKTLDAAGRQKFERILNRTKTPRSYFRIDQRLNSLPTTEAAGEIEKDDDALGSAPLAGDDAGPSHPSAETTYLAPGIPAASSHLPVTRELRLDLSTLHPSALYKLEEFRREHCHLPKPEVDYFQYLRWETLDKAEADAKTLEADGPPLVEPAKKKGRPRKLPLDPADEATSASKPAADATDGDLPPAAEDAASLGAEEEVDPLEELGVEDAFEPVDESSGSEYEAPSSRNKRSGRRKAKPVQLAADGTPKRGPGRPRKDRELAVVSTRSTKAADRPITAEATESQIRQPGGPARKLPVAPVVIDLEDDGSDGGGGDDHGEWDAGWDVLDGPAAPSPPASRVNRPRAFISLASGSADATGLDLTADDGYDEEMPSVADEPEPSSPVLNSSRVKAGGRRPRGARVAETAASSAGAGQGASDKRILRASTGTRGQQQRHEAVAPSPPPAVSPVKRTTRHSRAAEATEVEVTTPRSTRNRPAPDMTANASKARPAVVMELPRRRARSVSGARGTDDGVDSMQDRRRSAGKRKAASSGKAPESTAPNGRGTKRGRPSVSRTPKVKNEIEDDVSTRKTKKIRRIVEVVIPTMRRKRAMSPNGRLMPFPPISMESAGGTPATVDAETRDATTANVDPQPPRKRRKPNLPKVESVMGDVVADIDLESEDGYDMGVGHAEAFEDDGNESDAETSWSDEWACLG